MATPRLFAILLAAALVSCATPEALTLDAHALHETTPRTISAPTQAHESWSVSIPYWNSKPNVRVDDPAAAMRARLLETLADRFALAVVNGGSSDLDLEISTTRWDYRVMQPKMSLPHILFTYRAVLRLKDNRTNQLLAEEDCDIRQTARPMRIEAMHDPEFFRVELRKTTDYCTADFRHVLGL